MGPGTLLRNDGAGPTGLPNSKTCPNHRRGRCMQDDQVTQPQTHRRCREMEDKACGRPYGQGTTRAVSPSLCVCSITIGLLSRLFASSVPSYRPISQLSFLVYIIVCTVNSPLCRYQKSCPIRKENTCRCWFGCVSVCESVTSPTISLGPASIHPNQPISSVHGMGRRNKGERQQRGGPVLAACFMQAFG